MSENPDGTREFKQRKLTGDTPEQEIVERHPDNDAISASIRDSINRITYFAAEKAENDKKYKEDSFDPFMHGVPTPEFMPRPE